MRTNKPKQIVERVSLSHDESIQVLESKSCPLCGSEGILLYQGLRDRLFNAPGKWSLRKCPNPECGLLWLDPMPLEEEIGKFYKGYYTHQFSRATDIPDTWPRRVYRIVKEGYLAYKYGYKSTLRSAWEEFLGMFVYLHPGRRADLDFSVMYLPVQPNGHLLDVGCGSGRLLKRMQELGWITEGVDFDPVAVGNARNEGLRVRLGALEKQQYPENYFDVITMSHLIEHVHNPLQLLRECRRILKPAGSLIVVTPNGKSWGYKLFKDAWLHLDPPRHLHIFTTLSLHNLVQRADFKKVKIQTTVRDANGLFIASRSIHRTGKYVWGSSQPRTIQIWARGMQLLEWAILKVKPNVGEEIALVAEK